MANTRVIYFRHMCKRQARKLAIICLAVCAGSLFINLIYTKNFKSSIQTKSFFASPDLFPFKPELAPSYHNVSLTRATQPPMPRHAEHPNRSLFKTLEVPPVPITLDERDREVIVLSKDELPSQGSTQGEAPSQGSTQGEAEKSKTVASDDAPRSHTKQRGLSSERKRNETPERKNEEAHEEDDTDDDPKEEMEPEPRTPVTDSKDRLSSAGEDYQSPPKRKGRNETSPANDAKKILAKPGTGASKGKHKEDEEEEEYEEYDGDSPNDFRDTVFDNEIMKFAALENENSTPAANATVYCPNKSPYLIGSLAGSLHDITKEELIGYFPYMEKGGRLRPSECVPRQRLAIIIPYRNRYPHLHIALHNLIPLLKRQQADVTFFVIEQALPSTFNRGALLNIGFLEAEKRGNFDCYIFHDVDLIPLSDRNIYRCESKPRHYAVAINKYKYKLPYPTYFGGVVGFSREQYLKVNGNSNLYIGWGGEDDDLLKRLKMKRYVPDRYPVNVSRYHMIKHTRDKGNEANPLRKAILKSALHRQDVEGLNTVKYKVLNVTLDHLYTWITVSVNTTEILMTAPWKTLKDVEEARKTWQREKIVKEKKAAEIKRRKNMPHYSNMTNIGNNGSTVAILNSTASKPPDKAQAPSSSLSTDLNITATNHSKSKGDNTAIGDR